ncbi:phosphotransferase [Arthrobacter sp. CG_A4]|uniref:phosphotransferase n=1 Tax=Arthrobacter sp. CG_A4 TaxID=3071706 RepID=UPI002E001385|nr:hypothetical protein [Arthrobacter sp. CG_A4]
MIWHPDVPLNVTDAAGTTWQVRRAWPEPVAGEYVLEVCVPSVAGARAGHLRQGVFELVPEDDPRLPSLRAEAAKGEVVAHRAHKRAVVRAGEHYIKVFRPGRAPNAAERHTGAAALAGSLFETPRVLAAGSDVVVFSRIPGRSYFDLGQDHTTLTDAGFDARWREFPHAWAAAVTASRRAGRRSALDRLPPHPPEAEAEILRRWAHHLLTHSAGIPAADSIRAAVHARLDITSGMLLSSRPDPPGWAHGDLHDKQMLGTGETRVPGLLDFDESCQAEAALDLANLDVHLELRLLQRRLTLRRYGIAHRQVLTAADMLQVSPVRFAAYAASTRLRLACLYSFRPPWGSKAARWLSGSPLPGAILQQV